MIVLAFDTATPSTVVGLQTAERTLTASHTPGPQERPGHAAQLLPLVAQVLDEAGLTLADVTRIGVGVGPGTFTGLRIGISTARGLAQGSGAELAAVSTLQALAVAASTERRVLPVLDARRGEAFVLVPGGPGAQALKPDGLAALVQPGDLAVGDGALRFRAELEAAGAEVPADDSGLHAVDAAALCRLAAEAPAADRDTLVPDYVRDPDAKPRQA